MMILDSDVIIWYLRGLSSARPYLEQKGFSCSVISYLEVLQGSKNKKEQQEIIKFFKIMQANIIQISPNISLKAQYYVEEFGLSHSMVLQDAIIAATAIENSLSLVTSNTKHYKQIPNLKLTNF